AEATMSGLRPESFVKTFIPLIKDMERRVAANQSVPVTYVGSYDQAAATAFAASYESKRQAEIAEYTPKGEVAEKIDPNAYLITTDKDTLRGQIEHDWTDKQGISKFFVFESGNREATEQKIDATKVLMVHRNGKTYGLMDFIPSYDVILPVRAMVEPVFTGERVAVFVFEYPDKTEYDCLVYHKERKKLNNLNGDRYMFNFNKAFAKYLEDCPKVAALAAEGEYEQEWESILEAMKMYDECQ
ncbi:MAG: hypothetical protein AAFQ68_10435, partial [Bacteroidota bacterium]